MTANHLQKIADAEYEWMSNSKKPNGFTVRKRKIVESIPIELKTVIATMPSHKSVSIQKPKKEGKLASKGTK
jgi:hypothetical protein